MRQAYRWWHQPLFERKYVMTTIYLLIIIGGTFGSLIVGLVLGLLLPPSDRLQERVLSALKVTTGAIVVLAAAMFISFITSGDASAIWPYWLFIGFNALFFVNMGALRGVDLRKYGRWT
jgi:hypothetical protein